MLANLNDVLYPAKKGGYGVGLFNAVNMEMIRGVLAAAEEAKAPVIIGTAQVLFPCGPLEEVMSVLIPMAEKASVPVVVHLDHGLDRETCLRALELGATSIMYDCSTDPYEENIRKVCEVAEIAHEKGATIESELGHVGNNGDGTDPTLYYTQPEKAAEYVEQTGIDALAIAVGNAHGAYTLPPKLDFARIHEIAGTVNVPLVLHGGSGLTDNDFREAIHQGISKVNIFTDLNTAAAHAARTALQQPGAAFTSLVEPTVEAIKQETLKKMQLFGSCNKA